MPTEYTALTPLPTWLQEILPAPRPPVVLSWDQGFHVYHPVTQDTTLFATLEEAYDFAHEVDTVDLTVGGITYEGEVPEPYEQWEDATWIITPVEDGTHRLLMFNHDALGYRDLQVAYTNWLEIATAYDTSDGDDFYHAYLFVDNHPAFWIRGLTHDRTVEHIQNNPFNWSTSDYFHGMLEHDGSHVHSFEAGSHVEPEYREHYADYDLEVDAPSYEDGIIALAQKISAKFHHDGSQR